MTTFWAVLLSMGVAQAQNRADAYGFTQTQGTYTPITGGTQVAVVTGNSTSGDTSLDDVGYAVALPTPFTFAGGSQTNIVINTNGSITFGTTATTSNYGPISSTATYAGAIAALGRDLQGNPTTGSEGEIRTQTVGSEFVIQYSNFKRFGATGSGDNFNFQIRLNTATGAINIVYGSFTITNTTSSTGTQIGLRGTSTADYNNRQSTTSFLRTNVGAAMTTSSSVTLSSAVLPTSGLTFTYTPSTTAQLPVIRPTATTVAATSATITYVAPTASTAPTGYTATVRLTSTNAVVGTFANATATTFSLTGLTASTDYTVSIVANYAAGNSLPTETRFLSAANCAAPTSLSISNNTTGNSATLSFTAPASGVTNYTVTTNPATTTYTVTASPLNLTGLTTGATYTVSVVSNCSAGGTAPAATVNFTVFTPAPANDNPTGAVALTMAATCSPTNGTTAGATTTTANGYVNGSSPDCAIAASPKDVWYTFTTAASGSASTAAVITVTGSTAGQIRVFSAASSAGPFTQVACSAGSTNNTVAPALTVTGLTASTTYYVRIAGYGSSDTQGPFTICVTNPPACSAPTAVSSNTITSTSANITFTGGSGNTSYSVTATPAMGSAVTVTGSASPIALTGLTPSTSYSVVVTGSCSGGATAASTAHTFSTLAPPPANDDCSAAAALSISTTCTNTVGTTLGATASAAPIPNPTCAGSIFNDVWYTVVVPASGTVTVATSAATGSPLTDTGLSVYSGTCGMLTALGCNDDFGGTNFSQVTVTGQTPGATLLVRVWAYNNGSNGQFNICATMPAACAAPTAVSSNTITSTSANITFTAGNGNTSYSVTATPAMGSPVTVTGSASPIALTGLTPGTSYSVVVTGNCSGGATAASTAHTFSTLAPPPANDDCVNAVTLMSSTTCTATNGTVNGATQSLAPILCNGFTGTAPAQDVWYRFTATGTTHNISVTGTFDGVMEVRTNNCAAGANIGCSDVGGNNESLTLTSLTPGTTYLVRYYPYSPNPTNKTFSICVTEPTDLTVSSAQNVPAGIYNNITIVNGGVATLTGTVSVFGSLQVQSGGTLVTNCQTLNGSGNFVLADGGELRICNTSGITTSGATGAVQLTGTRTYSPLASYVYNATSSQSTGSGLPAQVMNLTTTNSSNLTLTQPVSVLREVRLTAAGNIVTTATNTLTLLSDTPGTALIVSTSTGTVTGAGGVLQRAITSGALVGYRHYSSPVQSTTFADLTAPTYTPVVNPAYNTAADPGNVSPFPTVFGYNQDRIATVTSPYGSFDKGWFSPSALTDVMQPTRGYTANVPTTALVDLRGTFNNGTQNSGALNRGTDPEAGWHLLGNPYPAPLDWSTVTAAQRPGMDAAMYVYSATSQYRGFYRTYVNGVGESPLVNAGQGYFVRVSAAGTPGAVNLTNANRVTSFGAQPGFGRSTADTRPQLKLQLLGGSQVGDEAIVYFDAAATAGVDAATDAVKLANPSGWNLASLAGNVELAINGLAPVAGTEVIVPLALRVPQAGAFAFEAATLANFGTGTVYLRDAQTGTQLLLSAGSRYAFTLAGTSTTRFSLVFRGASVTAAQSALLAGKVSVYPNPAAGRFAVLLPPVAGQQHVQATLLNALGQVVASRTIALTAAGATSEFDTQALAAGVYVLRLQAGTDVLTQRVVVE
ncbi:hypothetical protein GCM10023185_11570 [Hymenobacter saemangeumensis]|uniref:Fibronectin type-III domain-containing protein n=1 Tax=Hymenobacter saemangeumensis TaxID=1084522 RepID=A0ABP8I6B1_9BACT